MEPSSARRIPRDPQAWVGHGLGLMVGIEAAWGLAAPIRTKSAQHTCNEYTLNYIGHLLNSDLGMLLYGATPKPS